MNSIGIDPKWSFYLGIAIVLETAIGQGAVPLTNTFPADWLPYIKGWSQLLSFIGQTIQTALIGYSSRQVGPLVTVPAAPSSSTIVKILIVAFALSFLVAGGSAQAATKAVAKPTASVICDPLNLLPGCKSSGSGTIGSVDSLLSKLSTIQNEIVTNVITDIQAADADAGTVITPATATTPAAVNDPIAHACYPAAVQFLQSLPVAKATTGPLFGVQLFQKKRDFINQLKAGLPAYLKIGCGALIGDEVQIFITMMGMVGVTVATGGITGLLPAATLLPAIPALAIP
jgi:hypothetical protein